MNEKEMWDEYYHTPLNSMKERWDECRISKQLNSWEMMVEVFLYAQDGGAVKETFSSIVEPGSFHQRSKRYYMETFNPPKWWLEYHFG